MRVDSRIELAPNRIRREQRMDDGVHQLAGKTLNAPQHTLMWDNDRAGMIKIRHTLPKTSSRALSPLLSFIRRKRVIREDIDEDTLLQTCVSGLAGLKERSILVHFCEHAGQALGVIRRMYRVTLDKRLQGELEESIVIPSEHTDIYVVIPRDEAAMTQRAENRAGINEPLKIMLITKRRKRFENL